MKSRPIVLLFSLSLILLFSCGTSKNGTQVKNGSTKEKVDKTPKVYIDLADYLRAKGGVIISGTGNNLIIQIRGINSIQGDTRPFFYIDGVAIGRSYQSANEALNPNNIKSVRILSSLSELAIYGENGNNGVILIKSKRK